MKDDKTSLEWLKWREAPHFLGHGTASLLSRCLHKAAWLIKVIKTETTLSSLDHACMCAKSFQSCLTLHNPVDCSLSGSSVHGILQVRILEWVAMPSSRGSSRPRDQNWVSYVSCIGRQVLSHWATWEGAIYVIQRINSAFASVPGSQFFLHRPASVFLL